MTGSTGEKCQQSGIYYCKSHTSNTIALSKGDTFPPCSDGRHGATWVLRHKA